MTPARENMPSSYEEGACVTPRRKKAPSPNTIVLLALLCLAATLCGCVAGIEIGQTSSDAPQESSRTTRAETYRSTWERKAASVDVEDTHLTPTQEIKPKSSRYTVMVYMIGSNLESSIAAGTHDLNEMRKAGIDFGQANVLVYAGGTKRWSANIPANCNNVLDLALPEESCIVAQTKESVSMGASATLSSFIDYCHENYPAEHTALILWDHGGGPLWGYGSDEAHDGDGLVFSELQQALAASYLGAGDAQKLDWVGFDACLMGSLENCVLWSDYAQLLVASEEVEPGDGWNYSFLETLNKTVDAQTIVGAALENYQAYYEAAASAFSNPDITLAAYDLGMVDQTTEALDELVTALAGDMASGNYASINRARSKAKTFGLCATGSRAEGYDLLDLVDLAQQFKDNHPTESAHLIEAIGALVVDSIQNLEQAHGISIYFPGENRELFETLGVTIQKDNRAGNAKTDDPVDPIAPESLVSETYSSFLEQYTGAWLGASDVDWTLPEPVASDEGLTLTLNKEQASALSSATYTVLEELEDGGYTVRTCELQADVTKDGVVNAPANPLLMGVQTDLQAPRPGWYTCVEHTDTTTSFVNNNLYLCPAGSFKDVQVATEQNVFVALDLKNDTTGVSIASVVSADTAVGTGGRNTVDASEYSGLVQVEFGGGDVRPAYDSEGIILPWDEWDTKGYLYEYSPIEKGFGFVARPASDFYERIGIQIVLTDVNGMRHAAKPITLRTGGITGDQAQTVTRQTKQGILTYAVMSDHADVVRYEGDDARVAIPASIDDVPVTGIANHAFASASSLEELTLPEGIRTIGTCAFANSGLQSLVLPASLEYFAPEAFAYMDYMQGFELAGSSSLVSTRDGVLFSADGSTLVAYPNAKADSYEIPIGTQIIGYGSFAYTQIREVVFPEGLTTIRRAAFYECECLTSVELPQSLEHIETLAFGETDVDSADAHSKAPTRIHIGPNVSSIGSRAFRGLVVDGYDVDPANTHYKSGGNCLLNAAADTVLQAPHSTTGIVAVPEGVISLGDNLFSDYVDRTEFILPTSIASIDKTSLPSTLKEKDDGAYERVYDCVIHAEEGSYAWQFAEHNGIEHDAETDWDVLTSSYQVVTNGSLTMAFKMYEDHAVLVSAGVRNDIASLVDKKQHELKIPVEVAGKTVTGIDLDPSYELPRGGETIEETDGETVLISASGVDMLTLPTTIQMIGEYGLSTFDSLTSVTVDGQSDHLMVEEDVLFSADGTILLAFPAGKEGSYQVPKDVEAIGSHAFYGADELSAVKMSENVESLGAYAFANCSALKHVAWSDYIEEIPAHCFDGCSSLVLDEPLPEELVSIDDSAFFYIASCKGMELPEGIERIGTSAFYPSGDRLLEVASPTLRIGAYLEELDYGALDKLAYSAFEVDEDNQVFQATGPFLIAKSDSHIQAFAAGFSGEARVPDGTRLLDFSLLKEATGVSDLYIPTSVETFDNAYLFEDSEGALAAMNVHVAQGSAAERFAKEEGMGWSIE